MIDLLFGFLPAILIILILVIIVTQGYVKAPPDHAYTSPASGRSRGYW